MQPFEDWGLGNALRVGNDADVQARLSAVLLEPDAREIIERANNIARVHSPFDHEYHGRDDLGLMTIDFGPDGRSVNIVNRDNNAVNTFGKLLNDIQIDEAKDVGNALRVDNELDLQSQLERVVRDPDAWSIIKEANFWSTQHAWWDTHGPTGDGEAFLNLNPDNTLSLYNRNNGSVRTVARDIGTDKAKVL